MHSLFVRLWISSTAVAAFVRRVKQLWLTLPALLVLLATLTAALGAAGATAVTANAAGITPPQLSAAGWTCIQPRFDPTLTLCAPPGVGLPPLPGTPGFENRAPSYEVLVFENATGAFIGTQHLLRPDIYERGTPPCPQQPGGKYIYNPRNDLWFCLRS